MASTSGKCLYYGSMEMDVRARKTDSTSYYSSFSLNLIKFLVQLVQRRGGKKERILPNRTLTEPPKLRTYL